MNATFDGDEISIVMIPDLKGRRAIMPASPDRMLMAEGVCYRVADNVKLPTTLIANLDLMFRHHRRSIKT